jgi:hypothetical protein
MKRSAVIIFIIAIAAAILGLTLASASTIKVKESNKVTICHATGSEKNPYVRTVVDEHATKGHFDNQGTPLAGHEDDILLQGDVECTTPEVPEEPETPTVPPVVTTPPVITVVTTPTPVVIEPLPEPIAGK